MTVLVQGSRHDLAARGPLSTDSCVGELAVPVRVLPGGASLADVDEVFRREPLLQSLAVQFQEGPRLLTRTGLQQLMIGPLGYGRAVHSRHSLRDLVDADVLVLEPDTALAPAAQRLLEREPRRRYDDALVNDPRGLGLLTVSSVFEQLAAHFAHQSAHDPLTGLGNRLLLADRVRRLAPTAPGSAPRPALLYVDLDGFKAVNDDFGHDVGDAVLVQYAARLGEAVRPEDVVARLGGDEFAVLLVDPVTDDQAQAIADRLVLLAAAPFLVGATVVHVGASIGIARVGDEAEHHVDEVEALLRSADLAMYRAKTRGRGRVERGEPGLARDGRGSSGRGLERRLTLALERSELSLAYQPKFELATGRLLEHEALARWEDDTGPVSPAVFIPAAERSGLIHRLGQWALLAACEQAQTWVADGPGAGPVVAVNVSPRQLADPDFVRLVAEVLTRTGLPPSRLCLEITETAAIDDLSATRQQLVELRATGVLIALDDFGTGYSSLTLLRALPLDWVKIDRSFVEDVADAAGAVLVGLVVEAAHSLGVRVCAEGVERPEQLAHLLAMGCDAVQGYLLGVPARVPAMRPVRPVRELLDDVQVPLTGPEQLVLLCDESGLLTYVSAGSIALLGRQPAEMAGTPLVRYLPERAGDRGLLPARHSDGSPVWLEVVSRRVKGAGGEGGAVLHTATDATARVRAELALADREERLGAAFDEAPIGMALTAVDGRHLKVNAALCRLLGRSEAELLGLRWQDITHPEDRESDDRQLAASLAGRQEGYRMAKRYVRADGAAVACQLQVRLLLDPDGAPRYVVAHVQLAA